LTLVNSEVLSKRLVLNSIIFVVSAVGILSPTLNASCLKIMLVFVFLLPLTVMVSIITVLLFEEAVRLQLAKKNIISNNK